MATRSGTQPYLGSVTFEDVPKKPPILTITLSAKKKTLWQKFQEAIAHLSPDEIAENMTATRKRIKAKLDAGGTITEEEIELINKTNEEQITKLLDDYKERAIQTTKLQSTDTSEEMKLKIEVQESLLDWLGKLFSWVIEKISAIFQELKEGVEWCFEKAKDLFKHLWSMFE